MQLPGRLGSTTLGDILGSLFRARVHGVLELHEDHGACHRVRLSAGQVTDVDTGAEVPRLGHLLSESDVRRRRQIELCFLQGASKPIGSVLLENGLTSRKELLEALRFQTNARLKYLYAIEDARIVFRVARTDSLAHTQLSANEVLFGRPRARDGRCDPARKFRTNPASHDVRQQALVVLGLTGEPKRTEIHQAFRRLAAELHPDRKSQAAHGERARSVREFVRLSAAYHELVA